MIVEIDENAGFCFGVEDAINIAESKLISSNNIYCLGDIVHNDVEVRRLQSIGLKMIDKLSFKTLKNTTVLFRAHGESPSSFEIAKQNNIEVINATCPIVKKLQERVKKAYNDGREGEQIIIYGQIGHAEAIALLGQMNNNGIVIENINDLKKIDFNKPITIFSQTTKSNTDYLKIVEEIKKNINLSDNKFSLRFNKTVCKQVSNRDIYLKDFAKKYDLIIFVSGTKSSNGKMLYNVCKNINDKTYFISQKNEINLKWFDNVKTVGISGATSTPKYQLNRIKEYIESLLKQKKV